MRKKMMETALSDSIKTEDFAANKTAYYTVDGKLYGVPFDSGSAGMYYRVWYIPTLTAVDEMSGK